MSNLRCDNDSMLSWFRALKRLAGYFQLSVDELCYNGATPISFRYLASTVLLNGSSGRLVVEPVIKALGSPLNAYSAHHPSVRSWPITEFRRVISQSSCPESERAAVAKLSHWLNANPAEIERWILAARYPSPRKMRCSDPQMWCVLPWHPAFGFRDFAKGALKELVPFMHLANSAFETPVSIRVSWMNAAPNDSIRFDAQSSRNAVDGRSPEPLL